MKVTRTEPEFQNTYYCWITFVFAFIISATLLHGIVGLFLDSYLSIPIAFAVSLIIPLKWTYYRFYDDRIEASRSGTVVRIIPYDDVIDCSVQQWRNYANWKVVIKLNPEHYSTDVRLGYGTIVLTSMFNRRLNEDLSTWVNAKIGEVEAHRSSPNWHQKVFHERDEFIRPHEHMAMSMAERKELWRRHNRESREETYIAGAVGLSLVVGATAILIGPHPQQQLLYQVVSYTAIQVGGLFAVYGIIWLAIRLRFDK
jgi:hypothetical protein